MHFNDLLIQLRTQALAGVAAISTVVGLFSKDSNFGGLNTWQFATAIFGALSLFWIAIWIIDFCYYNRLLLGSANALFAPLKYSFLAGTPRAGGRFDTVYFPRMSRRAQPDYFSPQSSPPVFKTRERLMGENVRTLDQALDICQASGGAYIQHMKSGTPLERISCKGDSELRRSFPSKLGKHDYVVVQGFMPRISTPQY